MTGDGSFFPDPPSSSNLNTKSVLNYHPVLEFNGNKNDFWLFFDDSDIKEKHQSRPLRKPQKPSNAHPASSKSLGATSKPGFSNTFSAVSAAKGGFLRPKADGGDEVLQVRDNISSKDRFKEAVYERKRSRSPERRRRSRSFERKRSRSPGRRRSPARDRRYVDRRDLYNERRRSRSREKRGRDHSRSRDRKDRDLRRLSPSSRRSDGLSKRSKSDSSDTSGDSKGRSNKAKNDDLLKKFAEKLQDKSNLSSNKCLSSVRLNSRLEDTKHRRAEAVTPIVFSLKKAPVKSFPATSLPQNDNKITSNTPLPEQISSSDIDKPSQTSVVPLLRSVPPPVSQVPASSILFQPPVSHVPPPLRPVPPPVSQQAQPLRVTDGVTVACAPALYKGGNKAPVSPAVLGLLTPHQPPPAVSQTRSVVNQPPPAVASQPPDVFSQSPPVMSMPPPAISQPMEVPAINETHQNLAAQALEYAAMAQVQEFMPGQIMRMDIAPQNMGIPPPGFGPMMRVPPGPPPGLPRPGQGIRPGMMGSGHFVPPGPFMGPPPHGPEGPFMGPPPHGPEGLFMGLPPHGPDGLFMGPPPIVHDGQFTCPPGPEVTPPFFGVQSGTIRHQAPNSNIVDVTLTSSHSTNKTAVSKQPTKKVETSSSYLKPTASTVEKPSSSIANIQKSTSSTGDTDETTSSVSKRRNPSSKPAIHSLKIHNFKKVEFIVGLIKFLQNRSDLKKQISSLNKRSSSDYCIKNGLLCTVKNESKGDVLVIVVPEDENARKTIVTAFVLKYPNMDLDALIELFEQSFNSMPVEDIEDVFENESTRKSALLKSTDSDFSRIKSISPCGAIVLDDVFSKGSVNTIKMEKSGSASSSSLKVTDKNPTEHSDETLEKEVARSSKSIEKTSSMTSKNCKESSVPNKALVASTMTSKNCKKSSVPNKALVASTSVPVTDIKRAPGEPQVVKSETAQSLVLVPPEKLTSTCNTVDSVIIATSEIMEMAKKSQELGESVGTSERSQDTGSSDKVDSFASSKSFPIKSDSTPTGETGTTAENVKSESAQELCIKKEEAMAEANGESERSTNEDQEEDAVLSKEPSSNELTSAEIVDSNKQSVMMGKVPKKEPEDIKEADGTITKTESSKETSVEENAKNTVESSSALINTISDGSTAEFIFSEELVATSEKFDNDSSKDVIDKGNDERAETRTLSAAELKHKQAPNSADLNQSKISEVDAAGHEVALKDKGQSVVSRDERIRSDGVMNKKMESTGPVEAAASSEITPNLIQEEKETAMKVAAEAIAENIEPDAEVKKVESMEVDKEPHSSTPALVGNPISDGSTAKFSFNKELVATTEKVDNDSSKNVSEKGNDEPNETRTLIAAESKHRQAPISLHFSKSKISEIDGSLIATGNEVAQKDEGHSVFSIDGMTKSADVINKKMENSTGPVEAAASSEAAPILIQEEKETAIKVAAATSAENIEPVVEVKKVEPMEVDEEHASTVVTTEESEPPHPQSLIANDAAGNSFEKKSEVEATEYKGTPGINEETKATESPKDTPAESVEKETTVVEKLGVQGLPAVEKSVSEVEMPAEGSIRLDPVQEKPAADSPVENSSNEDRKEGESTAAELEVPHGSIEKDIKDSKPLTVETQNASSPVTVPNVVKTEITNHSSTFDCTPGASQTEPSSTENPCENSALDVSNSETRLEPMETNGIVVATEEIDGNEVIFDAVPEEQPPGCNLLEKPSNSGSISSVEVTDQPMPITESEIPPFLTTDGSEKICEKSNVPIQAYNTDEDVVITDSREKKDKVGMQIGVDPEIGSTPPAQVKEEPTTTDTQMVQPPVQKQPTKQASKFKSTYELMKSMEFDEPKEFYNEPNNLNILNYEKLSFLAPRLKEIQNGSDVASLTSVMTLTSYDVADQYVIKAGLLCKRKDMDKNYVFIVLLKTTAVYREIVSALTEQYPELEFNEFMSLIDKSFSYITSDEIKSLTKTIETNRNHKMKLIKYQNFIERCHIVNYEIIQPMLDQLRTMQKADRAILHRYNRLKVNDGFDDSYILKYDIVCQFVGTIYFKVWLPVSHPDQIAIMYIVHETNHNKDLVKFLELLRTTFEGVNASLINQPIALCSICHPPATANATSLIKVCEQRCPALKALPPEVIFKMRQIQMASSVYKAQIELLTKGQSRQGGRYILDSSLLCKAMTKGTEQVYRVVISPSGLKEVVSLLHLTYHRKPLSKFISFVNEFLAVTKEICESAFEGCYICNKSKSPKILAAQKSPSPTIATEKAKTSEPSRKDVKETSAKDTKGNYRVSSKVSSGKDGKVREQGSFKTAPKETPELQNEPHKATSKPFPTKQVEAITSKKTESEHTKTTWEPREKAIEPQRTKMGERIRKEVMRDLRSRESIHGKELGDRIKYMLRLVPDRILTDIIKLQKSCPELLKTIKDLGKSKPMKDDKAILVGEILLVIKHKMKPKIAVKPIKDIHYHLITKFHFEVHDWSINKVHSTIGIAFDISPSKEEVDKMIDWFCHKCMKPETKKKKKIYSSPDEQIKAFYSMFDKEEKSIDTRENEEAQRNDDILKGIKKDLRRLYEIWGKELGEKIEAASRPIPEAVLKAVIAAQRECPELMEIMEQLETSVPVKDARHVLCGGILFVVKSKKKAMLVKIHVKPVKNINYVVISNLHEACHDWNVNRLQTTIGISFDVSPSREEIAVTIEWFCERCQKADTSSKKKKASASLEENLKDLYNTIDPSFLKSKDDDDDKEAPVDLTQEVPVTDVRDALAKLPNPVISKIQLAQMQSAVLNTQIKLLENTDGPAKGKSFGLVMSLLCTLVKLNEKLAWRLMIPSEMMKDLVAELHTDHFHHMVQEDFAEFINEFLVVPEDMINEIFATCALCLTTVRRVPTLCELGINEDLPRKTLASISEMIEFVIKWQTECPAVAKIRLGVKRRRQEVISDYVLYKDVLFKLHGKAKGRGRRPKIAISLLPNATDEVIKSTHAFYHSNNPNQLMNLINSTFDVTVGRDTLVTKISELCNICRKKSEKTQHSEPAAAEGTTMFREGTLNPEGKKDTVNPIVKDDINCGAEAVVKEEDLPIEIKNDGEEPPSLGVLLLGRLCDQVIEESSNSSHALDSPVPEVSSTYSKPADSSPVVRQTCKILLKRCKYDPKIVQKIDDGITKSGKKGKRGQKRKVNPKTKEDPKSNEDGDSGSEMAHPKRKFVVYSSESETDDSSSTKRKASSTSTRKAKKQKK